MPRNIPKKTHTKQPQYAARLADKWRNKALFVHLPSIGLYDLTGNGYNLVTPSSLPREPTIDGISWRGDGSAVEAYINKPISVATNEPFTMLVRFRMWSDTPGALLSLRDATSGTPIISLTIGNNGVITSANRTLATLRDDASSLSNMTAADGVLANDNKFHTFAIRRASGSCQWSVDGSAWVNFTTNPTNAQGAITITNLTSACYFNDPENTNITRLAANITLGAFWKRAFSDTEIKSFHKNPWQIFQPVTRRIPQAAGGGSATGTLAFTTDDVTFAATGNFYSASTGTLAFTTDNVTFAATGNFYSASTGTLAFTTDDVVVAMTGTFSSPNVTGTLAFTTDDVTFAATGNFYSASTGTLAFTTDDVTVSINGTVVNNASGTLAFTTDDVTVSMTMTLTGGDWTIDSTSSGSWTITAPAANTWTVN